MMEPLWLLLKDVEDIRLSSDLLEPEIQVNSEPQNQSNNGNNPFSGKQWNDKNRQINSEYENSVLNDQKNYTIKIEDSTNDETGGRPEQDMTVPKKEQPSWMSESTVSNINNSLTNDVLPNQQNSNKINNKYVSKINSIQNSNSDNEPSKEILETLLIHEKQGENSSSAASLLLNDSTNYLLNNYNNNETNEDNEDVIMSDEEEEDIEEHQPMVTVGNQSFLLSDINDEIIARMTDEEKEEYIRLTQQVYAHMYDI